VCLRSDQRRARGVTSCPAWSRIATGRMLSGESPKRTVPSRAIRASRFDPSLHVHTRVPTWRSTSSDCSTRSTPNVTLSRPNAVGRATPFENCRHGVRPPKRSDSVSWPEVTFSPPPRSSSLPPSAGRVCAGALTREPGLSGEPSSPVRYADASCAFAPRRVASSETAKKAVRRSAAETARSFGERRGRTAVPSASAERALRRRSGKLAMFSPSTRGSARGSRARNRPLRACSSHPYGGQRARASTSSRGSGLAQQGRGRGR
jgi:hypothetical protein